MRFIKIDYKKIRGFKKLTQEQQRLFIETYERHNAIIPTNCKEDFVPVAVKPIRGELRVTFRNREKLRFAYDGMWY